MARKRHENKVLTDVRIEKAAAEGQSLAHVDGKVLFVGYTAPGDLVDVEVYRQKSGYMQGRVLALKEASPLRCEPFCRHFGLCGGCKWQHLKYEQQLKQKQAQVTDNLMRIGKVALPEALPILGCFFEGEADREVRTPWGSREADREVRTPWGSREADREVRTPVGYRNKLEFTFSVKRWLDDAEVASGAEMGEGERCGLGFHLAGKFDKVLDLHECFLQPEPSNEIRLFIKQKAVELGIEFYDVRNHTGYLRNMMVRNTLQGEFMVVMMMAGEPTAVFKQLMDAVQARFPQIKSLMYAVNTKVNDSMNDLEPQLYAGEPYLTMSMPAFRAGDPELKFRVGPKSFYQTNSIQAANLYRQAAEFADISPNDIVYDLYTGTGTIANYVARMARKVIGIEYIEEAVHDARINSRINGIDNTEFFAGDMAQVFTSEFIAQHGSPDIIITDPPRDGMHEKVVECILSAAPRRVVYVSCNSATQARDLARLDTKYRVAKYRAVDMFPHTDHVESLVLLALR